MVVQLLVMRDATTKDSNERKRNSIDRVEQSFGIDHGVFGSQLMPVEVPDQVFGSTGLWV